MNQINPITVGSIGSSHSCRGGGDFFPTVNNASNSINVWIIAKFLMKYVTCS